MARRSKNSPRYLFASYSRANATLVQLVIDAVQRELKRRRSDLSVWVDSHELQPGSSFDRAIAKALASSVAVLSFLSRASLLSLSFHEELSYALDRRLPVIPILLEDVDTPLPLRAIQTFDLTGDQSRGAIEQGAVKIVDAVLRHVSVGEPEDRPPDSATKELAAGIAAEIRKAPEPPQEDKPPQSVFVVHGHEKTALAAIVSYLRATGIEPVLLSEIDGPAQSLFQKFLQISTAAHFAIVLFSADDLGAPRTQYDLEGVADRALQFRPRQNVVLELGFFYGHLGWENVFVVWKKPDKLFPNFERPSDLDGVVFDELDEDGRWRNSLGRKLREAGFPIP